jgi:Oxidoreductase molybdopterin binding domain
VTPRATDWSLAAVVALLVTTGVLTLYDGPWVFVAHDVAGFALGGVLVWKARRVWRRLLRRRLGAAAALLVAGTLATGWAWSSGFRAQALGYNALNLHGVLGALLGAAVLAHAGSRARRPHDVVGRRQLLASAGVGVTALAAWRLQRVLGPRRRFTGSYEVASFAGNAFPTTSWVADAPRPVADVRITVVGARMAIGAQDALTATLDCTGGFYSTQEWRGARLSHVLPNARGDHVRVISRTGYRRSFPRAEAGGMLLATHVGGEPLSHGHGAPVRLVAPGRRGFEWVKWVERVELHDGPDLGALASTVWSSFTPAGRGA